MAKTENQQHYGMAKYAQVAYSKTIRNRMSHCVNLAKAMFINGHTSNGRTNNFCFACFKRKIIAIGWNDYRKNMDRYMPQFNCCYKHTGEATYVPSLHAEVSCLLKLGLQDCSHIDFFSVRLNRNGKCCMSKPCDNCAKLLKQVGFKHVWFFDSNMEMKSLI